MKTVQLTDKQIKLIDKALEKMFNATEYSDITRDYDEVALIKTTGEQLRDLTN